MTTKLILSNSRAKGKRYRVQIYEDGKYVRLINFGSIYHENYTIHKDLARKKRYINRHKKEDWSKINAGSLSRYILWNKPSLKASIKDFEKRFGVKILTSSII
jgi:Family of unknown function (DUF5754)